MTYTPGSYQPPSFTRPRLPALSGIHSSASTGALLLAPFQQDRSSSERKWGSVRPRLPRAEPSLCCPLHPKFHFCLPLALPSTPRHWSILRSSCLARPFIDNSGTTITATHWKCDIFLSPLLPTSTAQNVFWEPGHTNQRLVSPYSLSPNRSYYSAKFWWKPQPLTTPHLREGASPHF